MPSRVHVLQERNALVAIVLADYLGWPEAHLEESDPLRRICLPQGDCPDLSFDERREWRQRNPQRNW